MYVASPNIKWDLFHERLRAGNGSEESPEKGTTEKKCNKSDNQVVIFLFQVSPSKPNVFF